MTSAEDLTLVSGRTSITLCVYKARKTINPGPYGVLSQVEPESGGQSPSYIPHLFTTFSAALLHRGKNLHRLPFLSSHDHWHLCVSQFSNEQMDLNSCSCRHELWLVTWGINKNMKTTSKSSITTATCSCSRLFLYVVFFLLSGLLWWVLALRTKHKKKPTSQGSANCQPWAKVFGF